MAGRKFKYVDTGEDRPAPKKSRDVGTEDKGTGKGSADTKIRCPRCTGSGKVWVKGECPACNGTGEVAHEH